ncbi:MAG: hypothetical protein GY774_04730 [Planctomycetes bacterium]|nr:hypothetical protein [Planctomycetota bacterium]
MSQETRTLDIEIRLDKARRDLKKLNSSLKDTEKRGSKASKETKHLGETAEKSSGGFGKLKGAMAAAFSIGALIGLKNTIATMEKLEFSLGIVFQSMGKGSAVFRDIQTLALETPFSIEQLTESVIKLRASGIEPTTAQLSLFADTASVSADSIGTLQAITDLFARTTSGGLGLEDLNRLMDRGIPVFSIFEEKLGLARLEVSEIGKTAEGAAMLLNALTEGLEERFGGAATEAAGLLANEVSNLGVAFDLFLKKVGDTGALSLMTVVISNASVAVNWLTDNVDTVLVGLSTMAAFAIPAVIGAVKALTLAIAANPIGLIIVAISTAVATIYHFREVIFESLVRVWEVTIPNAVDKTLVAFLKFKRGIYSVMNSVLSGIETLGNRLISETPDFLKEWLGIGGAEFKLRIPVEKIDAQMKTLLDRITERVKAYKTPPAPTWLGVDDEDQGEGNTGGLSKGSSLTGNLLNGGGDQNGENPITSKQNERLQQQIEALELSLADEEEKIFNSHANRQFIIEDAYERELITAGKYQELQLKLNSDFEKQMSVIALKGLTEREKFEQLSAKNKTKTVLSEMVTMTQGVAQHNKTLFEINKASGIANALVGAYEGFNRTMGAYPYPFNIGMAALSLASSLAQVQAIRSTSFTGGGGGTTPSAAGSTPMINTTPIGPIESRQETEEREPTQIILRIHGDGDFKDLVVKSLDEAVENDEILVVNG